MYKYSIFNNRKVNRYVVWIMFLFFGWSYGMMNQSTKQLIYYLTLGGCGLWTLYILFTLNRKIKRHNVGIAVDLGMDIKELNENDMF